MGIMLGLLTGCGDKEERMETLVTLKRLLGAAPCLPLVTCGAKWTEKKRF